MNFYGKLQLREVIEENYRIVYQVHSDRVSILTVFESHRLFPTNNVTDAGTDR